MIVGIDARAAAEVPAGRGRVVRELLAAMAERDDDHEYVLYARRSEPSLALDGRFRWREIRSRDPVWHVRAALRASRECEVFLSTNSYLTTWFLTIPSAVIVHDFVAFERGARAQRRAALIERATIRPALHRAGALLCNSRATCGDLERHFPRSAAKSHVIGLAANRRFRPSSESGEDGDVLARHGLRGPFVLSTGTLEPRKNLPRLVEAHAGLPDGLRSSHPLAIAGPSGWEVDETLASVRARREDVRLLGFVSDDDLAALYRRCTVFCYPSLYEGFGLPVLEAMSSGAPTITSNVSSLPEVGGDAVWYVDPFDVADIRRALRHALEQPGERSAMAARALERAATFSWARTAETTLEQLERLAAG